MTLLLSSLLAHLAIVATWKVLALAVMGIGLLYRRLFTTAPPGPQEMLFAFWCGFAAVLFILQLWHLTFAINAYSLALILALGAIGLVRERSALRAFVSSRPWSGQTTAIVLTTLFILWAANHATGPVTQYDSGMYHIPVVEWAKAYPIVPGLANLHGRLAFNSSGLLFAAMLDHGPWSGRAYHIANSLLLVVFGLQTALAWSRLLSPRVRPIRADVFDALLLIPAVGLLIGGEISSLDTDVPVALMLLVAASRLHRSLASTRPVSDDVQRAHFAGLAILLGASVCAKLSAVVLAGSLFIVALWVFRRALFSGWTSILAIATPVVMGIVWMVRGIILSGYPAYPATVFGTSVVWRVPQEQASAEAAWIRMSAHELNHNRIVAGFDWLSSWAREIVSDIQFVFLVPVPLAIVVVLGVATFARRQRGSRVSGGLPVPAWMLLFPAVVGAVFWFLAAPHPRFGMGPMWILAACSGAMLFATLPEDDALRTAVMRRAGFVLLAACVACVGALAVLGSGGVSARRGNVRAIAGIVIPPGPDHGLHPMARPDLVSYTTRSGLELAVPKENNLCWNGPLLCTPHPAPNLRLRNPGKIASGFILDDGVWAPLRWPNPWTPFLPWLACRREQGATSLARDRACISLTARAPVDSALRPTAPPPTSDSTRSTSPAPSRSQDSASHAD